jgi:hypothetical protein
MNHKLDQPPSMFLHVMKGCGDVLREECREHEPAKKKHHRPDVIAIRTGNAGTDQDQQRTKQDLHFLNFLWKAQFQRNLKTINTTRYAMLRSMNGCTSLHGAVKSHIRK